ncbi:MAG TPA: type I restriction enzyme HsdR N-terminal domain-containing protein [Ohtaekwangia sp.]
MISLNLPSFEYQLKKEDGKVLIFDSIRKKYLVLTPEEWVRQHFIHYLINERKYPRSLIRLEGGLSYNTLSKRSDIVVFNREGKPWMVVECKAHDQPINDNTLRQASIYNAKLQAKYLAVTNGLVHYYFETDWLAGKTSVLQTIPVFE